MPHWPRPPFPYHFPTFYWLRKSLVGAVSYVYHALLKFFLCKNNHCVIFSLGFFALLKRLFVELFLRIFLFETFILWLSCNTVKKSKPDNYEFVNNCLFRVITGHPIYYYYDIDQIINTFFHLWKSGSYPWISALYYCILSNYSSYSFHSNFSLLTIIF